MNKLVYLSVLVMVVFLAMTCPLELVQQLGDISNGDVSIYCLDYDGECVNIGIGKEVHTTVYQYNEIVTRCNNIQGVTVTFSGTQQDVTELLSKLQANVVYIQQLQDIMTVYAFSPLIVGGVWVDGNFINIQVALSCGVVHVGSPLILGSY